MSENELIVNLTIDGTEYEEAEVIITDPNKTIRDQIDSIIRVFELPKTDMCGHPIQYLLSKMLDKGEDSEILDFKDEYGHEQSLMDYGIQSRDDLHLISVPLYACPVPEKMRREWAQYFLHNK